MFLGKSEVGEKCLASTRYIERPNQSTYEVLPLSEVEANGFSRIRVSIFSGHQTNWSDDGH